MNGPATVARTAGRDRAGAGAGGIAAAGGGVLRHLWPLVWREWRHHPWRHGTALLAVALGVALAFSVHLINRSALAEFSQAVRSANGEPDLVLRGQRSGFDDALFDQAARAEGVRAATPVLEVDTYARATGGARPANEGDGGTVSPVLPGAPASAASAPAPAARVPIRVLGIDGFSVAPLAPDLLPRAAPDAPRLALLEPGLVFLNAAARQRLGVADGAPVWLQHGTAWQALRVGGSVAAGGGPLAVLDVAAAQAVFGLGGRLTRIDLQLAPGASAREVVARLALPAGVQAVPADEAEQRVSNLSRAYRVNLTVLALVALFVGAFLVFSVLSLSVAQRTPALALLGVLGLTAAERRQLVLAESAALGAAGSVLGLALGTLMAQAALRFMAGDLGGGYFPGIAPALQIDAAGALLFGALGTASAVVGGWWPARQAQAIAPAQALKGLGSAVAPRARLALPLALLAAGVLLAFLPPILGLPLAAYASVALLLFGGVALVPVVVEALLAAVPQPAGALPLLALRRARFQRHTATAAVAGVVASLALSVALTVMVASFREGVTRWLDRVLPADLYARSAGSSSAGEQAWLPEPVLAQAAALPGVARAEASRSRSLQLAPGRPAVTLIARPLGPRVADALPLVDDPLPADRVQPGEIGAWVSEGMAALYDARPGTRLELPVGETVVAVRVLGTWRDYARQFGAIAVDLADYRRATGDTRLNDLALWLAPGARPAEVQAALRARMDDPALLEFAATADLRAISLRIFDRSFAVTYYLQAVAIAIGLVGIAASLSAQVLARRKEFGLLSHLGLTRRQVLAVVAGEAAAWLAAGVVLGLLLGIALALVLVFVVNPQSFHWTMDLVLPWWRLAALAAAVMAAGLATAAFAARAAASRAAVLSVKEDW